MVWDLLESMTFEFDSIFVIICKIHSFLIAFECIWLHFFKSLYSYFLIIHKTKSLPKKETTRYLYVVFAKFFDNSIFGVFHCGSPIYKLTRANHLLFAVGSMSSLLYIYYVSTSGGAKFVLGLQLTAPGFLSICIAALDTRTFPHIGTFLGAKIPWFAIQYAF